MSKRITSFLLCIFIVLSLILQSFPAYADITPTELLNGSPLLNEGGQSKPEVSIEDHVALSLYMSSMCIPFFDNYATAFLEGEYGSKGEMAKFIQFTGNENDENLHNYILAIARSQYADRINEEEVVGGVTSDDYFVYTDAECSTKAKLHDIYHTSDSYFYTNHITDIPEDLKLYVKLPKDENSPEDLEPQIIFDASNEMCKTAFQLCLSVACLMKDAQSSSDDKLFIDVWGNICARHSSKEYDKDNCYIVFPNCWNPYVISDGGKDSVANNAKINLLNYNLLKLIPSKIKLHSLHTNTESFNDQQNEVTFEMGWWRRIGTTGISNVLTDAFVNTKGMRGTKLLSSYVDINNQSVSESKLWSKSGAYWLPNWYSSKYTDVGNIRIMNQILFLNYLCIAHGQSDGFKLNKRIYATLKTDDLTKLLKEISTGSEEQQRKGIIQTIYGYLKNPVSFLLWIGSLFSGLFVLLYNLLCGINDVNKGVSQANLGFSKVQDLFKVSTVIDFIFNNWMYIFMAILVITIATRMLGRGKDKKSGIPYSIMYGVIVFILILVGPKLMNTAFNISNRSIIQLFGANQNGWLWDYNINYELNSNANSITDLKNFSQQDYNAVQTLRYEQDKSPVVLSNTSDAVLNVINESGFGYLLLGMVMKQYVKGDTVSTNIEEMFRRLTLLNYVTPGSSSFKVNQDSNYFNNLSRRKSLEADKGNNSETLANMYNVESNSSWSSIWPQRKLPFMFYPEYTKLEGEDSYKYVYKTPADSDTEESFEIGSSHENFFALNSNDVRDIYIQYFDNGQNLISKFNYYEPDSLYDRNYGYFILTENVIPYFYKVWSDLFQGCSTKQQIATQIQGMMKYSNHPEVYESEVYDNESISPVIKEDAPIAATKVVTDFKGNQVAQPVRKSVLMIDSVIHDYVDLKELFTKVIPYCVQISEVGRESFKNDENPYIGDNYKIYKDNPKYWLFDSNWAVKLNNIYKNVDFNSIRWSEADLGDDRNIVPFEGKVLTFYEELTPQVEQVIDYFNTKGVSKQTLIRQLAILSGLEFNRQFSSGVVTLQPQNLELASISIDILFKDLLRNHGFGIASEKSAGDNLLDNTTNNIFIAIVLFLTALIWWIFGAIRFLFFTIFFYAFMWSLLRIVFNRSEGTPFAIIIGLLVNLILSCLVVILPLLTTVALSSDRVEFLPLSMKFLLILIAAIFSALQLFTMGKNQVVTATVGSGDMGYSNLAQGLASNGLKGLAAGAGIGLATVAGIPALATGFAKGKISQKLAENKQNNIESTRNMSDQEFEEWKKKNKNKIYKDPNMLQQAQLGRAQAAQMQSRDMIAQQGSTLENISNTTGKIHRGVTHANSELAQQGKTLKDVDSRSQSLIDRDNQDKGVISL